MKTSWEETRVCKETFPKKDVLCARQIKIIIYYTVNMSVAQTKKVRTEHRHLEKTETLASMFVTLLFSLLLIFSHTVDCADTCTIKQEEQWGVNKVTKKKNLSSSSTSALAPTWLKLGLLKTRIFSLPGHCMHRGIITYGRNVLLIPTKKLYERALHGLEKKQSLQTFIFCWCWRNSSFSLSFCIHACICVRVRRRCYELRGITAVWGTVKGRRCSSSPLVFRGSRVLVMPADSSTFPDYRTSNSRRLKRGSR